MEPALRGGDTCKEMFVNVTVPEDDFGIGWGKRNLSKVNNSLKREFGAPMPALRSTLQAFSGSCSGASASGSREEQVPTVPVGFGVWNSFYK